MSRVSHSHSPSTAASLRGIPYQALIDGSIGMSEANEWSFPGDLQPSQAQVGFDLPNALAALVRIRSAVPGGAFTANALGTERAGNGIAICLDNGSVLVLTNGYVMLEANDIWLTTHDARVVPGYALEFDEVSGLGLIMPLGDLHVPTLAIGSSKALTKDSPLWILGSGGAAHCAHAKLQGRQTFAAFWEYLLEDGLLVTPLHPEFGGAALVDNNGVVRGVGALVLHSATGDERYNSNLFVPAESIMPLLGSLNHPQRPRRPTLPWLGIYAADHDGQITIMGLPENGPAAQAKLHQGDVITAVAGQPVSDLVEFYRHVWQQGAAGCTVELTVRRKQRIRTLTLKSIARSDLYFKPRAH